MAMIMIDMKCVAILLLCWVFASSITYDWNCYKGCPERTGSIDAPAPDTLYLLWEVDLQSALYSSPVVKNGNVFQVMMGEVLCIDLSGNILWTAHVPAYYSTPAISDDNVIVATNCGISALSVENGDLLWEYVVSKRFSKKYPLDDYIVSSPVVSDGKVVVGTRPYNVPIPGGIYFGKLDHLFLICLNEETGKEEWYIGTTLGVYSSPCVSNGKIFASSREILCIDLEKGKVLWNSEKKYPFDLEKSSRDRYAFDDSTPALYHGIFIGGSHLLGWQKIVAIDQYTGNIFWEWVKEGALTSSPAVSEGKIYVYSYDGMVHCLSLLDGRELWTNPISEPKEYNIGGNLWPSPVITDHKVFIGSIEGVFYCLDSDTGNVLWKYKTGGPIYSVPAIVPGKVLISSTDGILYCFGIDPATYKTKAEQYLENKEYQKAEEFLLKAKENVETSEETEEIDRLLDLVASKLLEYQTRVDNLSEAESLMDKADEILWNNKFKEAKNLYIKAYEIFKELDDELGVSFCEKRIEYIEKRIAAQSWIERYWWLLIVLICLGVASIFLLKKLCKLNIF